MTGEFLRLPWYTKVCQGRGRECPAMLFQSLEPVRLQMVKASNGALPLHCGVAVVLTIKPIIDIISDSAIHIYQEIHQRQQNLQKGPGDSWHIPSSEVEALRALPESCWALWVPWASLYSLAPCRIAFDEPHCSDRSGFCTERCAKKKTLVKLKRVENSLDHSPAPSFIWFLLYLSWFPYITFLFLFMDIFASRFGVRECILVGGGEEARESRKTDGFVPLKYLNNAQSLVSG